MKKKKKETATRNKRGYYTIKKVPHVSVTTFLKVIGKPFLMGWYASMERKKILALIARGIKKGYSAKKSLKKVTAYCEQVKGYAADKYIFKRGDAGNVIHKAIDSYLATGKKPKIKDKGHKAAFKNFLKWWKTAGYEVIETECVISDQDLEGAGPVAGTMDAYLRRKKDKKKGIFDWKTGKSVYAEHHLQLNTYRHLARKSHPSDFGMIAHIPQDGGKVIEYPVDSKKFPLKTAVAALRLWRGLNE